MTAGGAWRCGPTPLQRLPRCEVRLHDLGPVTVSLIANQTGRVLASAEISDITNAWQPHRFTLKTGDIAPSSTNHLAITVAHPGTLWLNLVSLFPPTYHDRPNGNRST